MSRERELLERTIEEWDSDRDLYEFHKVIEEIRDFLPTPQPEQDEEPVAWTNRQEINALTEECTVYMYAEPMEGEDNIPLFLHPAQRPDFVRLCEEEIGALANSGLSPDWTDEFELYHFARAIEDALEEKNTINKSDPDSVDLQSRCRGDKS